ncbi:MAG: CbiQ family ECF transporter T component [Elusimicrobiota bacterium]|nr:hypothetical protein [Endomicrobiia bacterium]MDW8165712.1 CbiQ family ECF transporter T component [Elusimicrobiota bacterium]
MKHSFFDKYSYLDTPIHRIRPEIKMIFFLIFTSFVIIFEKKHFIFYILSFVGVFLISLISKVPFNFLIKKIITILPFVFLVAICNFFSKSKNISTALYTFLNSSLVVFLLILLVETTKFYELLSVLKKFRVPKILIILLSFIYRYFFVLIDEIEKTLYSIKLRSPKKYPNKKSLANIVGMLFIKSFERAERIYYAMIIRGFSARDEHN